MLLISCSSVEIFSSGFLKIKTPISPAGDRFMHFCKAEYPHLRNRFLFTASFATLLGAIKEIFIVLLGTFKYLKVKWREFKNLPALKIFSTSLVVALFFLGSIAKRTIFFCLFGAFF